MHKFCIVFEDAPDANIAADLADRVICENIQWIEDYPESLDAQREWRLASPNKTRLRWCQIKEIARGMRLPIRGNFDGANELPDFKAALRAIHVVMALYEDTSAIILIRDADNQLLRRDGIINARKQFGNSNRACSVVIGVAITKRECWVLSGFEPKCEREKSALKKLTKELGADPTVSNNGLTATGDHELRSAKRILSLLSRDDRAREKQCWQETSLQVLRSRGAANGLNDYLTEVGERLVPIVRAKEEI